ncbi:MAG: hypothetical protein CMA42_04835 [Euryarchaeota archaeon]|nr:hypothetical protein [Euryarchaeota archaeon]
MRSCSISDVVVVQLPNRAVMIPRAVDTTDANTAMCMDRAFRFGLIIDSPPVEMKITPNKVGNRAVT